MPETAATTTALITNDAIVLGLLAAILGLVFWTSSLTSRVWKGFYGVVPALLLCYFLPSLLTTFGLVDPEQSKLYFVASRYRRPAGSADRQLDRAGPGRRTGSGGGLARHGDGRRIVDRRLAQPGGGLRDL